MADHHNDPLTSVGKQSSNRSFSQSEAARHQSFGCPTVNLAQALRSSGGEDESGAGYSLTCFCGRRVFLGGLRDAISESLVRHGLSV